MLHPVVDTKGEALITAGCRHCGEDGADDLVEMLNDAAILGRVLIDSLREYAIFAVAVDGSVISWNGGATKLFGYTSAEILGRPFSVFFTAEDTLAREPEHELSQALDGTSRNHDRWHVRCDGTRFWGTNTVEPLYDTAGSLLGFAKLVRDATASHLALEALSDSEQQMRVLIESVSDHAIFTLGLDGTICSWNSGAEKVFGYAHSEIVGRDFAILFGADDVRSGVPLAEMHAAAAHGAATVENWLFRKDGSRILTHGKLSELRRDRDGRSRGFVNVSHDVTADDAATQELRRRAQYDELTQLPNRRTLFEHIARAIASMRRRTSNLFAVLFIDLDQFKSVNDRFGHAVADSLLAITARRLESCLRSEDIAARIGGDEFAILLNGISGVADAQDAADRICTQMREPARIAGHDVCATVSIGIALGNRRYKQPEDVLRDADAAMYVAKSEGRSRAVVFGSAMVGGGPERADDVRAALASDEFRLAYQPIVDLRAGTITGFEALIRWEHPRRGLLGPLKFIPLAEESELIIGIDRWTIGRAARQLAVWRAQDFGADLHMSVNVSSQEFSRDTFVDELRAVLATNALPARAIQLEITERAVLERSERATFVLAATRAAGVALHVDDFGTGYSSLSVLQHVAVDALKIEASFVAQINTDRGTQLIEIIIALAHKLGVMAIAEGVETMDQLAKLIELGCDYGQGFLFSAPLDAEAAATFARESWLASTAFVAAR